MRWDFKTDVNLGSKDSMNWRIARADTENPAVLPSCRRLLTAAVPSIGHRGLQYRRHLEPYLEPQPHHVRPGGWNFSLFKRDNPAEAKGELFNQKYGIKGGNDARSPAASPR